MFLGINLEHNSSLAITDFSGKLLLAIEEERLSRVKNHWGVPALALSKLSNYPSYEIKEIIIGSTFNITAIDCERMLVALEDNPSMKRGIKQLPKYPSAKYKINNPKLEIEKAILKILAQGQNIKFTWVKHHDSHLGCALGAADRSGDSLLISLDGQGDGESGAISTYNCITGNVNNLARFSSLDSLGLLYSAVTNKYNFTRSKHEGKITGLAAYGNYSTAVSILLNHIEINNGIIRLKYLKGFKGNVVRVLNLMTGGKIQLRNSIDSIIDLAETQTLNYADLAYAIQFTLEKAVLEIVNYWQKKLEISNVSLSGGVFANVKLNQKIAELTGINKVSIFPNMSDGGISAGSIWSALNSRGQLSNSSLYENMYLGFNEKYFYQPEKWGGSRKINSLKISNLDLVDKIVELLCSGMVVGVHQGRQEFGPRALGNRSILIDPRNKNVNSIVNKRLKRTEFMPFAPIVIQEDADKYFEIHNFDNLEPFRYMTMTCVVKKDFINFFPAVVHVDGTARPQFISIADNPLIYRILQRFKLKTGIGVLINTSFNVHEEPINDSLENSLEALTRNAVDYVVTENELFYT